MKYRTAAFQKAVEDEREACALIAIGHKGAAQRKRREKGYFLESQRQEDQQVIIHEERGENIAADEIARKIRERADDGG